MISILLSVLKLIPTYDFFLGNVRRMSILLQDRFSVNTDAKALNKTAVKQLSSSSQRDHKHDPVEITHEKHKVSGIQVNKCVIPPKRNER